MKNLRRSLLQLTASIVLAVVAVALMTHLCFAACDRIASDEQQSLTGHIVGDTVARGIDFALKPVHRTLSSAFFFLLKPCEPEPTTIINAQGSSMNE